MNVMKSTFRVLFYLRKNEVNKSGNSSIMVRITVNGEQVQFSSKLQIRPELWDTKNGKALGKSAAAMNTNRLLEAISAKANELYHKHLSEYGYVLPEKIKNIILGIDSDRRKMLLEHFEEHNEFYALKVGKDTSQITANRYKLTKLRLQEFLKAEYNLSDIPVFELTPVFVEKFFLFLRNTHNCSNNTALKFIQRFRAVFYYIKNTGADIKINPFGSFKFRTSKVVREILTQEELDIIYKKEFLTERLGQVRDIFIFMCYTGLSYIDVAQLTEDNIKTAFDGHQWAYRGIGPFSKNNKVGGVITVFLTLKLFNQEFADTSGNMSALIGFELVKNNKTKEVDLVVMLQEKHKDSIPPDLVFCECKTYKNFTSDDADRMIELGREYPNSILTFATLNDELTENEKTEILKVVNHFRTGVGHRPTNPVLILTAKELLPKDFWGHFAEYKKDSKPYHRYNDWIGNLCEFTVKKHLNVKTWGDIQSELWQEEMKKRNNGNIR